MTFIASRALPLGQVDRLIDAYVHSPESFVRETRRQSRSVSDSMEIIWRNQEAVELRRKELRV